MKLLSGMVGERHIKIVLEYLEKSLAVEGDVVELGCFVGTTSVFIQEVVKNTDKTFHVYDSFQGLPELTEEDNIDEARPGAARTTRHRFLKNFEEGDLPVIHEGWFKDSEYPEKICFAFFDGDLYSSIMDSFDKVYDKVSVGGYILVHDYGFSRFPGVKKACDKFLEDKSVEIVISNEMAIIKKIDVIK